MKPQMERLGKRKQVLKNILWIGLMFLLTAIGCRPVSAAQYAGTESEKTAGFSIRLLDVGQGLCLLIEADGEAAIYDGGGRETSSYVVARLQELGITELDYMFVSHYDEDHLAGLVGVLHTCEVKMIAAPEYSADTQIYASFEEAAEESGAGIYYPAAGDAFLLGNAQITVLAPEAYDAEIENNRSIAIQVSYGSFTCIITGDAEAEEEAEILELWSSELLWNGKTLQSDLYIAGHHGSATSSTEVFLDVVSPSDVWISVGTENEYGHPSEAVLERLKNRGIRVYRTDVQGELVVFSDGTSYWMNTEPTQDWNAGERSSPETETLQMTEAGDNSAAAERQYILNSNSMKFHYPDCEAVEKMAEKNKIEYTGNREDVIALGYVPCKICQP